jgi:hypothetical protein
MEQGAVSLLDLILLVATLTAFGAGLGLRRSWRLKLGICLLLTLIAWALRAVLIVRGDVATAEEYLNGLNLWNGAAEIAVGLAWAIASCGIGTALASVFRRMKAIPR